MDYEKLLRLMAEKGASDLYITVGAPPHMKIEGSMHPVGDKKLSPAAVELLAVSMTNAKQKEMFEADLELDFAIPMSGVGRFRVNMFKQRNEAAMVIRYITGNIPPLEDLHLPSVLKQLIMKPRGLVLVVGSAGAGKSTTLASMINYRNEISAGHILTIEDPIEYIHKHKKSLINQREVGMDTHSFTAALKRALREAPDVIMIGEIRDLETMEMAIAYAESGHLCISTLHANNAHQTLDRIMSFFPDSSYEQLYMDLSMNLQGIISQRLLMGVDGARIPAVEVLLNTPHVKELIREGDINGVDKAMSTDQTSGADKGMSTFEQSLYNLYVGGKITEKEALDHADSRNDLSLKIRMSGKASKAHVESF